MQKTPADVKARILKAGYVLAPILLIPLNLYSDITQFIPAGYYDDYIVTWPLIVLAVQIAVLIWVRKLPALISLIMSILVSVIVPLVDGIPNIGYLGFVMANSPMKQYRDRCVTVPYFDGRAETLGYCQTIFRAGQLFQEDIMIDTGGWIIEDAAKRPRAWNKAFGTLTTTATHSKLFQVAALEDVDDRSMRANEIGHGYFVVLYNAGEDY